MNQAPDPDVWIGTTGCGVHLGGSRATTTGILYSRTGRRRAEALLVRFDLGGGRALVEVEPTAEGNWGKIKRWYMVDRDQFDKVAGIDEIRAEMGWSA